MGADADPPRRSKQDHKQAANARYNHIGYIKTIGEAPPTLGQKK